MTVGEPFHPTGASSVQDTAELREVMSGLLDRTVRAYPADEQPAGSWWLPASYGGTAPTPEEAVRLDQEEKRERARRRAQKRARR
jgi:hypothetical protein